MQQPPWNQTLLECRDPLRWPLWWTLRRPPWQPPRRPPQWSPRWHPSNQLRQWWWLSIDCDCNQLKRPQKKKPEYCNHPESFQCSDGTRGPWLSFTTTTTTNYYYWCSSKLCWNFDCCSCQQEFRDGNECTLWFVLICCCWWYAKEAYEKKEE